jgi:hypothetical protein
MQINVVMRLMMQGELARASFGKLAKRGVSVPNPALSGSGPERRVTINHYQKPLVSY